MYFSCWQGYLIFAFVYMKMFMYISQEKCPLAWHFILPWFLMFKGLFNSDFHNHSLHWKLNFYNNKWKCQSTCLLLQVNGNTVLRY